MSGSKRHLLEVEKIAESLITGTSFEAPCGEVTTVERDKFLDQTRKPCRKCVEAVSADSEPSTIHVGLSLEALFELVLSRGYQRRDEMRAMTYPWTLGASSLTAWPTEADS